ncbi:MAG: pyridoxal 5'-phosphate synthase glutaminase subunit PdxT [Oscillospiraceae bacterium]|nr:pyridoxal 5'-phosphate synthase glutaminase subunit PdxT [Oscillospiraceae bacterium]
MAIGILTVQGGFAEHAAMLDRLGAEHFEIRQLQDLQRPMEGLILPGGESTVMGKLLRDLGLFVPLREKIMDGLPTFGTCAGLILLAKEVEGGNPCFATMDISVMRNAYGRQLGSFFTVGEMKGVGQVPMTFIRAPYISAAGSQVEILAEVDQHIVAARQGYQLVTAFHPELNDDLSIHRWFLENLVKKPTENN